MAKLPIRFNVNICAPFYKFVTSIRSMYDPNYLPDQAIKHAPDGFAVYSGDDGTAVALMLLGGHGNVSVTANVAPRLMHELCAAALSGDVHLARSLHLRLLPLHLLTQHQKLLPSQPRKKARKKLKPKLKQ